MALYAIVEEGQAFEKIPALLSKAAGHFKSEFQYLDPPSIIGDITVSDIHKARTAADHCAIVVNWSKSVWKSWSAHHTKIATLYQNTVELL